MEVHSSCGASVIEDLSNDLSLLSVSKNAVVDKLGNTNIGSLHLEEARELSDGDDDSDVDEGNMFRGFMIDQMKSNQKSFNKFVTSPHSNNMFPSSDEEDEPLEENFNHMFDMNPTYTHSISLPPLPSRSEFISAIKGSREKQGTPPKEMNVSWAPGVYDPSPTVFASSVKGGKKHQKQSTSEADNGYNKKKGKNKVKGGKGGRSRENKQFRRGDKAYRSAGND